MKRYKLYTQDVNRRFILRLFKLYFKGFTYSLGAGAWNGKTERTIIFDLVNDETYALEKLKIIALHIKAANKQEAVLITHEPITEVLI